MAIIHLIFFQQIFVKLIWRKNCTLLLFDFEAGALGSRSRILSISLTHVVVDRLRKLNYPQQQVNQAVKHYSIVLGRLNFLRFHPGDRTVCVCASLVSERAAITRFLDPHYLVMGLTTKTQKFQGFFRNSIDDEIKSLVRSNFIGFF